MYQRILVAVDGSPTSDRGLAEAVKLAALCGARIRVINVLADIAFAVGVDGYSAAYAGDLLQRQRNASERILAAARATVEAAGLEVETAVLEGVAGRVSELVVDEAKRWPAELIVVGTHGRRGMRRFVLGSDAEQIIRLAPVPVLLVRSVDATASPDSGLEPVMPMKELPP